jgi:hypothetical protein
VLLPHSVGEVLRHCEEDKLPLPVPQALAKALEVKEVEVDTLRVGVLEALWVAERMGVAE